MSLLAALFLQPAALAWPAQDAAALQKQAIERIERCVAQIRKTGNPQSVLEEMRRAEDELSRSYQGFIQRRDNAAAALSLHKMADLQRLQSRWRQAQELYRQANDLARQAGHRGYQIKTLIGLARISQNELKDHNAVIAYLDEAIRLSDQSTDKRDLFDLYDLKAAALDSRGDLTAAFDFSSRAFAIAAETNDPELLFYGHFGRGSIYQRLGSGCDTKRAVKPCIEALDRARTDLDQAMAMAKKLGYDFFAQHLTTLLKNNERWRTILQTSESYSQRRAKIDIFSPTRPGEVTVSEEFYGEPGTITLPETVIHLEGIRLFRDDAIGDCTQARLLYGQGKVEAALQAWRKGVERLEADRRRLSDETGRGNLIKDRLQVYYDPALVLLQLRQPSEAFELIERSRSRVLSDLLQTRELKFTQAADRALYAESARLSSQISNLQKDLLKFRIAGGQNAVGIAAAEKEIQRLEAEYKKLTNNVVASGSKLKELIASQPASLSAFGQLMKQEGFETLSYLVQDGQVVLWHFSGDAVHVRSVVLIREQLINKISSLRRSLKDPNARFDEKSARELFLFLIQPALQWIKSDRLVIIPHDDLNYIPFQALIAPDGRALGERFSISYAPSATVLLRMKKAESLRTGRLLAVADPSIVEAGREVAAIGKLYPQNSRVISNPLVKESDLKTILGGYDLVHLSVHGKFTAQEPLLSHLKLEPGGADDGQLTAAEMFGLPLQNARLVVLSACDTGQAQATRANEVIGMVRALLYAGANNIVLSSWEVDAASTALWMETFYREAQTKSPVEAARAALIAVKRDPRYSHPYFWSPFLLIGR